MLVSVYAQPYASHIYFGTKEEALRLHYIKILEQVDIEPYRNQRVVIKVVVINPYLWMPMLPSQINCALLQNQLCMVSLVQLFHYLKEKILLPHETIAIHISWNFNWWRISGCTIQFS